MMSIYPIVCIKLSFVQFSLLCYEFCILSKTECKSIYYHFRRDQPEINGFVEKPEIDSLKENQEKIVKNNRLI